MTAAKKFNTPPAHCPRAAWSGARPSRASLPRPAAHAPFRLGHGVVHRRRHVAGRVPTRRHVGARPLEQGHDRGAVAQVAGLRVGPADVPQSAQAPTVRSSRMGVGVASGTSGPLQSSSARGGPRSAQALFRPTRARRPGHCKIPAYTSVIGPRLSFLSPAGHSPRSARPWNNRSERDTTSIRSIFADWGAPGEASSMNRGIECRPHPNQSEDPRYSADPPQSEGPDQRDQAPHRVRLPGFITDGEIGFGDVMKRTTSYLGIQPCGGCERRAAALNRWLVFTHRKPT